MLLYSIGNVSTRTRHVHPSVVSFARILVKVTNCLWRVSKCSKVIEISVDILWPPPRHQNCSTWQRQTQDPLQRFAYRVPQKVWYADIQNQIGRLLRSRGCPLPINRCLERRYCSLNDQSFVLHKLGKHMGPVASQCHEKKVYMFEGRTLSMT